MPFIELLLHLKNQGDEIASKSGERLTTEHGHVYVQSASGIERDGDWWRTKYIWVRV